MNQRVENDGENRFLEPVFFSAVLPHPPKNKENATMCHITEKGLVKIKYNHSHDPDASGGGAEDNGGKSSCQ